MVSTTRSKLAGFTGTQVSSGEAIDISGNTATSRTLLSGGVRESHFTRPGVSEEEVRTYYSGRMASQQMRGESSPYLFGYDALGRQTSMKNPRHTQAAVTTYTTTGNQIVTNIDAAGNPTSYAYYPQGSVGAGQIRTITLADATVQYRLYTLRGELKASWGSQLNPTWNEFDAFGQLSTLHTWQIAPALNIATPPSDPPAGSATTSWNYQTATGLLIAKRDAVSLGADYEYDVAGRLTKRTWARSQAGVRLATLYTPNSFNEITSIDYADNTPDVTIAHDRLGRRSAVTQTNQSKISYAYDSANLALDTETIQYDLDHNGSYEFTRVLDRSRDFLNRDNGFQLKDGTTLENQATYGYSATDGRLLNVVGGGDVSSPQTFTYGYTSNSNLLQTVTGPTHTVTNTWEPNRDVLDTKENKVDSTVISNYDYAVNAIGQRTAVATSGTAFPALPSWAWGYDSLGQVVTADSNVSASDRAYQYDAIGNRKKSADSLTLPSSDNYTSNALNQYSSLSINNQPSTINPSYDFDGNAIAYPLPVAPTTNSTLVWDAENRQISSTVGSTTTTYLYDAQFRRIAKATGGTVTLYIYDGWNSIAEYTQSVPAVSAVLSKTRLWGTDLSGSQQGAGGVGGLLSETINNQPSTLNYFPTYDGNGNVSEYLSTTGTTAAHYEYDPFGHTVVNSDTSNLFTYRFSTKPLDSMTGLCYYGYRYYNSVTGRWLSRDPIEEEGGMNLYGFVGNDGVNKWDRLGLENCCSQNDGTVDDSCCLKKCEAGCGGNTGCIVACFDTCTKGEVPTGLEIFQTPKPLINPPSMGDLLKKLGDVIFGFFV